MRRHPSPSILAPQETVPAGVPPRAPPARTLAARAALAGLAGGVAMMPFGLVLRRVMGRSLNVYGELLLQMLVGRVTLGGLLVEHLAISVGMAFPLVALFPRLGRVGWTVPGVLYGAGLWLVVNSISLPLLFGRPTPWVLGWATIWPSLTVHVVYGLVAAAVARLSSRPPKWPGPERPRSAA